MKNGLFVFLGSLTSFASFSCLQSESLGAGGMAPVVASSGSATTSGAGGGGSSGSSAGSEAVSIGGGAAGADTPFPAAGNGGSSGSVAAGGVGGGLGSAGAAGSPGGIGNGAPAGSPVALNGALKAKGNRIVGSNGTPVQLKGMSLYWSQLKPGSAYYNADVINWLATDWQIKIVRIAIAVTGNNDGDYLSNRDGQLKLLDAVVQAATNKGIYALIDWHDHHANMHLDAAKEFFGTVSKLYGDRPNVLYEIWNEPRGQEGLTWGADIKPYAEAISKVIRQNDPSNLMIVGTPFWDQQPDAVLGATVNDVNVAYTLHFYAGSDSHKLSGAIGTSAKVALAGGLPLFVTEWGTVDPVNQAIFNEPESRTWMTFLDQNMISSCNWSITSQPEGSAAILPTASTKGGWSDSDLSQSGKLVRSLIQAH